MARVWRRRYRPPVTDYKEVSTLHIHHFIILYGYWALFIGCLAEGETVAMLGGLAAHQGLLHYGGVVASVALGGITGDMLLFFLGRRYGYRLLKRIKPARAKMKRARRLILRHPLLFVMGVRFMYGFRLLGPLLIGVSRLSPLTFILFNIIGAALWAVIFVTLGYWGGQIIMPWLSNVDHHLRMVLLVAVALMLVWLVAGFIRRLMRRPEE
ncbi:DedA family protein [Martelella alba]|uniref:DedA family protein n=1 Tax=Martelella alba TaxID=2590451 RepID=A0ABY2SDV7_9HYPH|nr:DedA family protein [Martelella alba]TKI02806.1 DedA family protein [Martelella alba]